MSRLSWSAPFANFWSSSSPSSPSPGPGAGPPRDSTSTPSSQSSTSQMSSSFTILQSGGSSSSGLGSSTTQYSQSQHAAPFPSLVSRPATTRPLASSQNRLPPPTSQTQTQRRQRIQSHFIPSVAVPPKIEEHVADAISSSYTPASGAPGPSSHTREAAGEPNTSVAETVAVLTSARRRYNATPRIVEAEDALSRAAVAQAGQRAVAKDPGKPVSSTRPSSSSSTTKSAAASSHAASSVERRPMSPTPPMEIPPVPVSRNNGLQTQSPPQPQPQAQSAVTSSSPPTTTSNGHAYTDREARYRRERDDYRRRCSELERGLNSLQSTITTLQTNNEQLKATNQRLEQALSTESLSKSDLIEDLARKRTYCESLGSQKKEGERKLLEVKLEERRLRGEVGRLGDENGRVKDELGRMKVEIARERREKEELRIEVGRLRGRERELSLDLEQQRQQQQQIKEEGRKRRKWMGGGEGDEEVDYWRELQAAKDELARAEKQHEITRALLLSKSDELKSVQLFTSRVDSISIADVIGLVNGLNAEILQASAYIADSLRFSEDVGEQVPKEEVSSATKAVMGALGQDMAKAIWGVRNLMKRAGNAGGEQEYDPTVIQYALQCAMTGFCERVINDWAPNTEANSWLESIYGTIQSRESQAVAGRWRALTRAQLGGAKDPSFIIRHLTTRLLSILILSGCVKSLVHPDHFMELFQDQLGKVASWTVRVQTASGENVTSVDMKVYTCPPGEGFTRDYMEDMYSGSGEESAGDVGKPIAGTTELGLLKKERKEGGQGEPEYTPLVKAKIVLAAVLRESP